MFSGCFNARHCLRVLSPITELFSGHFDLIHASRFSHELGLAIGASEGNSH
jgi:hypothetical protein